MPERASADNAMDPVRARLAGEAASVPQNSHAGTKRTGASVTPQQRRTSKRLLTVNRKIMVSEQEARQIEDMTSMISEAFGSKVTYSQVSRALWSVLGKAEDAIVNGRRRGAMSLAVPSKGDDVAMAEYEEALADFLTIVLKRS